MGARRSIPLQTAYCASTHGVDGFLEALRVERQHDRVPVDVTQILPAAVDTPLFDNARTRIGVKPVAPPPAHPARVVADAIVHAAVHPWRDIVVGGSAPAVGRHRPQPMPVAATSRRRVVGDQHRDPRKRYRRQQQRRREPAHLVEREREQHGRDPHTHAPSIAAGEPGSWSA